MKLQLISDLHTEFYQGPNHVLKNVDIVADLDFLVVAGDSVVFSSQPDQTVKPVFKFFAEHARHVVLVEGNHEYYTAISSERVQQRMGNMVARYKNVHWLRNSEIKLDGVHFFGAACGSLIAMGSIRCMRIRSRTSHRSKTWNTGFIQPTKVH